VAAAGDGPTQIAEHVGREYRLPEGGQLVAVTGGPMEIAGLPLDDQKMLLGRYRMAAPGEQQWVRETIGRHLTRYMPELAG